MEGMTALSARPRIISASRRTDIPAFYGEWFMRRLREGWALTYNPFSRRVFRVSLVPSDVAAIVFWSKNFGPFLPRLAELAERGYNMVFHYTITGLPRVFEGRVPDTGAAVAAFRALAGMFSSRHVQWRYDPVLLTTVTDKEYHLRRFRELCGRLEGLTTRCYTSFVCLYPKVRRRLEGVLAKNGVQMQPATAEEQRELAGRLAEIAAGHGIALYSCCGDHLVGGPVKKARCVDGGLLAGLFGLDPGLFRPGPSRKQCGCSESTDIGMYDTCPHACVYCYANAGSRAFVNYRNHDPDSPALISASPRPLGGKRPFLRRGAGYI